MRSRSPRSSTRASRSRCGCYVEPLFAGRYDASDRELPNLSPAGYVKLHEVAVAAIIKAHRRNETKLYQTLMAYLRVTQADQADIVEPAGRARAPAHHQVRVVARGTATSGARNRVAFALRCQAPPSERSRRRCRFVPGTDTTRVRAGELDTARCDGSVVEPVVTRRAVRALIVDRDERLLLVHFQPTGGDAFWTTPGGGVEPGESDLEALRRELVEEVGLHDPDIGPCVWTREHEFVWHGPTRQVERIYLVRVDTHVEAPGVDLAAEGVDAVRWWTMDELAASGEVLAPSRLVAALRELLAGPIPASPYDVGVYAASHSGSTSAGGTATAAAGTMRDSSAPGRAHDRLAVVREGVAEPALAVGARVAEVAGQQRGGEVGREHDDVPLAAHRVVGGQVRAANAGHELGPQALAERADEAGRVAPGPRSAGRWRA